MSVPFDLPKSRRDGPRSASMRPMAVLITAAIVLSMTATPSAAQFRLGDVEPIVFAGGVQGNGSNRDVDIGEVRLGFGNYFRESLGLYGELSLYRPTGRRDGVSVATYGLGLSFAVRWHFLQASGFSLFTDWGLGMMYGVEPFPPGGTRWNFTPHYGAGVSVPLRPDVHVLAGVRQLHMSNGKGLVEENPSFDGLGVHVGVGVRSGYRAPQPPVGETLPFGGRTLRLCAETMYQQVDEEDSYGGLVSVDVPVLRSAKLHAQLAFSLASLVGEETWEAAIRVYRQTDAGRLALGYVRKEFSVFTSDFYSLQIERVLNDVSTLQLMASLEDKNLARDYVRGGVFIVVYPLEALALRSGIGFVRPWRDAIDAIEDLNDAGFEGGVEWSPRPMADSGLSVFFDAGMGYDVATVGLRFEPTWGSSVRERHRQGSFLALR